MSSSSSPTSNGCSGAADTTLAFRGKRSNAPSSLTRAHVVPQACPSGAQWRPRRCGRRHRSSLARERTARAGAVHRQMIEPHAPDMLPVVLSAHAGCLLPASIPRRLAIQNRGRPHQSALFGRHARWVALLCRTAVAPPWGFGGDRRLIRVGAGWRSAYEPGMHHDGSSAPCDRPGSATHQGRTSDGARGQAVPERVSTSRGAPSTSDSKSLNPVR